MDVNGAGRKNKGDERLCIIWDDGVLHWAWRLMYYLLYNWRLKWSSRRLSLWMLPCSAQCASVLEPFDSTGIQNIQSIEINDVQLSMN